MASPNGALATDWELVSADAESTDMGESLTWTSNDPMSIIHNDQSVDASDPVGNACEGNSGVGGAGLTISNGGLTVECSGGTGETSATKTGAAMIEIPNPAVSPWVAPTTVSCVLVGTGLQAITFGLLVS